MKQIDDNNSDFEIVYLYKDKFASRETPHCKLHGAMNKVSTFGLWRCLRGEMGYEGLSKEEIKEKKKDRDCRAGCIY